MAPNASRPLPKRVRERRRAVALAHHYRETEGPSIAQIADRLGCSPATVKAYFYDPTGAKARAVKARYQGVCRGCGRYTQPRNGKGDAYAYCKVCHPGAIERRWTRARVLEAMRAWRELHGRLPSSYDWSRTHARRGGGVALERLAGGDWPAASVVTRLFGTWSDARAVAAQRCEERQATKSASASSSFGRESISLPKPRESAAISKDLTGGEPTPEPIDLQVLLTPPPDFAHDSGR
jgi:AcrR family transcriptional regulator